MEKIPNLEVSVINWADPKGEPVYPTSSAAPVVIEARVPEGNLLVYPPIPVVNGRERIPNLEPPVINWAETETRRDRR